MKFLFFGELMLRITPEYEGIRIVQSDIFRILPGGSEANSAVAISSLGMHKAIFLSSIPKTTIGEKAKRSMIARGVDIINISSASNRMGLYWVEIGKGPRASDVYYDRDGSAFDLLNINAITSSQLRCDWFHCSGITPGISERTYMALEHCLRYIPEKTPISIDLNFRRKLWSWTTQEKMRNIFENLCRRAYLISGNESDYQNCLGINGIGKTQEDIYASIASALFNRFESIQFMAVNSREIISASHNKLSGMLFVRSKEGFEAFRGINIEIDAIVDRLGTGDSFTAGILYGIASFNADYQKIIDFAVMLSALNHTTYGDFSDFSETEVLTALQTNGRGDIKR